MRNELEYIYLVYQKGSFTKAAQALYLTQPALSIAIQKIENEIGMPLPAIRFHILTSFLVGKLVVLPPFRGAIRRFSKTPKIF